MISDPILMLIGDLYGQLSHAQTRITQLEEENQVLWAKVMQEDGNGSPIGKAPPTEEGS
jgi:hypothetical protein